MSGGPEFHNALRKVRARLPGLVERCAALACRTMGPGLRLPVGVFGMTFSPCLRRRPDQLSLRHTKPSARYLKVAQFDGTHILSAEFADEVAKVKNNVTGAGHDPSSLDGQSVPRLYPDCGARKWANHGSSASAGEGSDRRRVSIDRPSPSSIARAANRAHYALTDVETAQGCPTARLRWGAGGRSHLRRSHSRSLQRRDWRHVTYPRAQQYCGRGPWQPVRSG